MTRNVDPVGDEFDEVAIRGLADEQDVDLRESLAALSQLSMGHDGLASMLVHVALSTEHRAPSTEEQRHRRQRSIHTWFSPRVPATFARTVRASNSRCTRSSVTLDSAIS